MPYTSIARSYLINDGIEPDKIVKIGSPMYEVLNVNKSKIKNADTLKKLNLFTNKYFLVSFHREENILDKKKIKKFIDLLNYLANELKLKVIVSTHFRTRKILDEYKFSNNLIEFHKPFGFIDYINLQINSKAVLSDSGSLTEEASVLDFNAIDLRDENERPEGMEEGTVVLAGLELKKIKTGLNFLFDRKKSKIQNKLIFDYNSPNFSNKVVNTIISYTSYINRKVWLKN